MDGTERPARSRPERKKSKDGGVGGTERDREREKDAGRTSEREGGTGKGWGRGEVPLAGFPQEIL